MGRGEPAGALQSDAAPPNPHPCNHRYKANTASSARCAVPSQARKGPTGPQGLPVPTGVVNVAARVYNSSDTSLPIQIAGAPVKPLPFDRVSFDTAGLFDKSHPTRLRAPIAGVYLITANVSWQVGGIEGLNRRLRVRERPGRLAYLRRACASVSVGPRRRRSTPETALVHARRLAASRCPLQTGGPAESTSLGRDPVGE